jgi:acetyl esterase/lipase
MNLFPTLHRALSGLGFLLVGCSAHTGKPETPAPPPVVTSYTLSRDLSIAPPDWPQPLLADLYVPEGAGPWPGVLLIHGGGWERGDREQVQGIAERLARRGYAVLNTTYRFAPQYRYPAQLEDVQQAMRWLQAQGPQHRIRPERLGAFGYSAGAHLAALLGTLSPGDALAAGPRPVAVVAGGTPSDLAKFTGGKLVPQFLGTSLQENPEAYRRASPIRYVSRDDPPFFIYHGGSDLLVSVDHAEDLKAALDGAGVPAELFILRGRGHIGAFLTDGPAFEAAAEFLDRLLR